MISLTINEIARITSIFGQFYLVFQNILYAAIFRLESQRIHPHLLHHRQQTIATGRRKMFFQSYLIDEIKIGI